MATNDKSRGGVEDAVFPCTTLVCAFLSDSFGRRQDGEEHCPPSVTFAALCDCKMQKNFHHATILQFISFSLFFLGKTNTVKKSFEEMQLS